MSSGAASEPSEPPAPVPVSLRRMRHTDLAFATAEHRAHFPDNVMGRLGGPFLRRYYATFLDTPFAVATVAQTQGEACGYLVGILDTRQHRRLLLRRHGAALLATALLGSFRHPRMAYRLLTRRVGLRLRRLHHPDRATGTESTPSRVAVLSHVATTGRMRGQGVGSALVTRFVQDCRVDGAHRVSLATLDGPAGAGPFYARQGWTLLTRRQTFDGRWIRLYDLELVDDA